MDDELTAGDEGVRELLGSRRTWAVVGCSRDPARDSHRIARLLLERGNRVVPVNPAADRILGQRCHPALSDVPEAIDVVDLFRRSEVVGAQGGEAIGVGAQAVWMQLGVIDAAAARAARAAGLIVVMNRCPAIEV